MPSSPRHLCYDSVVNAHQPQCSIVLHRLERTGVVVQRAQLFRLTKGEADERGQSFRGRLSHAKRSYSLCFVHVIDKMPDILDDRSEHVVPFILERLKQHYDFYQARKETAPPFFCGLNGVQGAGKTTLVGVARLIVCKIRCSSHTFPVVHSHYTSDTLSASFQILQQGLRPHGR